MTRFLSFLTLLLAMLAQTASVEAQDAPDKVPFKVGIIGVDTSHAPAFAKELNNKEAKADVAGFPVVAAFPQGSRDIASSVSRVPKYTEDLQGLGVEIVDSIPALLEKVDGVLLESNDGRVHLEQVLPVLKAGKPVFVDKPVAASLAEVVAIYRLAEHFQTPLFSSSSLRYTVGAQEIREGAIGEVLGCDAYSPCSLEKTHAELYWYGIHGVETLFTVMGTGCEEVSRLSSKDFDLVAGKWSDGRLGTFRGIRQGTSGYGGTAFGSNGIRQIGPYGGYRPLVVQIAGFFRTKKAPVAAAETIEIYAFMEAADESKRQGGKPVKISEVLAKAEQEAATKVKELIGQ